MGCAVQVMIKELIEKQQQNTTELKKNTSDKYPGWLCAYLIYTLGEKVVPLLILPAHNCFAETTRTSKYTGNSNC